MNTPKDNEMVTLFYSEKAAKTYGAYTAIIPDGNGSEKSIVYTCPVSTAKKGSYLWDDKIELATCMACDLKDPKACTHKPSREMLAKSPPSSQLRH